MHRQLVGGAVGVVFAEARADHIRAGQGDEAADRVYHAGAGVVRYRRQADALKAQPAAAPDPVAVERIDHRADHEAVGQIRLRLGALGDRAGHDGGGGAGKDHLEHPGNVDAPVIPGLSQKEVAGAGDARRAAAHHYGETESPEGQRRDGEVHEALGHIVGDVLGADQPGAQESEPRLHEKDQERRHHGSQVADVRRIRFHRVGVLRECEIVARHQRGREQPRDDVGQKPPQQPPTPRLGNRGFGNRLSQHPIFLLR